MTTPASERLISIIMPVYNEVDSVDALIADVHAAMADVRYEMVLVNDGSTDGTTARLDALAAADTRVRVIHFRRNFGQTAAMMAGFHFAQGAVIVPMDADRQNDPLDVPALVAKLDEGFDVVSGWRRDRQDNALKRVLPSKLANWLISRISGVRLRDYGCTLKAYRREVIEDVHLYGEMHRFVPIYASWNGARVTELPVRHHPRRAGTSKYGLIRIPKVLLDLIVVKFLSDYSQKPIYIFGGFALLNFLGSFGGFGWMLYFKFFGDKTFIETPLPQLVTMFFLMGVLSLLMGLLAELNVRTYYEAQGKKIYKVDRTVNLDER